MSDWPRAIACRRRPARGLPALRPGPAVPRPADVVERCADCDLDLRGNDAGDGPAVFVILGLGAIVMILVFWVEFRFEPPWWVHVADLAVRSPSAVAVWMLRF